jgi:hypothetical protein
MIEFRTSNFELRTSSILSPAIAFARFEGARMTVDKKSLMSWAKSERGNFESKLKEMVEIP